MPSSHVSPRRLSEVFRFLRCVARCAVRTWNYGALFQLSSYLAVTSSVWVLLVEYRFGIREEMLLPRRLSEKFHKFSLARWIRILMFLFLHVRAEWRSVLSRCFSVQSFLRCSHWEI